MKGGLLAAQRKSPSRGRGFQAAPVSTSVTCTTRSATSACTCAHAAGASAGAHTASPGASPGICTRSSASASASVGINACTGIHARAGWHTRTGVFVGRAIHSAVAIFARHGAIGIGSARRKYSGRHQASQRKCSKFGGSHVVLLISVGYLQSGSRPGQGFHRRHYKIFPFLTTNRAYPVRFATVRRLNSLAPCRKLPVSAKC